MNQDSVSHRDAAMEASRQRILADLAEKRYFQVRDELLRYNEADIAEFFEDMLEDADRLSQTIVVYRLLPKDCSVEVFSYLPSDDQLKIVSGMTDQELRYIVDELDFDDKIDVLEELPANLVDKILVETPKAERKLINTFLNYPDDCAGSIMTPDYISLQKDWTVGQAMAHIKREGMDSETVYTCYVKDTGRKLIGIVSLRTLVISDDSAKIRDLMHTDFVCVNVYDDQEEVSEVFRKYGFLAIPVVDREYRLVGIVTMDDILEVIDVENTEDMERMAGIVDRDSSDREYLDKSVMQHARSRLPWLLFMMLAAMVTGAIISRFESLLSSVIVLVSYMPLLMGTGGNTGAQASTLIIRGLAMGEVEQHDVWKVLWKEFRISLVVGAVLSSVNFAKILLVDGQPPRIALTVCLSMLLIVMFAKMIGSLVPLLADRLGADPALMANPVIASSTDMVSVLTYFLMASLLLHL